MNELIILCLPILAVVWLLTGCRNPFWRCSCGRWLSFYDKIDNWDDGVHATYRCKRCGYKWIEDEGCH